jgi:sulfatase modifying factor 1
MNWQLITRLLWVGVLGIVLTAYPFNMAWGNRSVRIPSGSYKPLYRNEGEPFRVEITSFLLDKFPTTNQQFLNFIQQHAQWKRSARQDLFADSRYLAHWSSDLDPHGIGHHLNSPVTNVSWFAATAYCRAQGKRLPTVHEWEYAASAGFFNPDGSAEPGFKEHVLEWYARPAFRTLPAIGRGLTNYWGVADLHGLIWEWVLDFNSVLVTGESRGDGGLERELFCGAGSVRSSNFEDYPAFMRFGLRSSLKAHYTLNNLGFRCASDLHLQKGNTNE